MRVPCTRSDIPVPVFGKNRLYFHAHRHVQSTSIHTYTLWRRKYRACTWNTLSSLQLAFPCTEVIFFFSLSLFRLVTSLRFREVEVSGSLLAGLALTDSAHTSPNRSGEAFAGAVKSHPSGNRKNTHLVWYGSPVIITCVALLPVDPVKRAILKTLELSLPY